jgi:AcrR family transcriptional regulator
MNQNIETQFHQEHKENEQPAGRDLILQQATRLFVAHGYNGISMREIAEASNMTKAALYYHFKDKKDLLREIFKGYLAKTNQYFLDSSRKPASTRQRLTDLVNEIFDQSPEKRGVLHLMFVEMPHLDKDLQVEISALYHSQFQGAIEAILIEGIRNLEIQTVDPGIAARLLLGMMYPLFHPSTQEQQQDIHSATKLMINMFFDGVAL